MTPGLEGSEALRGAASLDRVTRCAQRMLATVSYSDLNKES